jgi:hypothetical protein
MALTEADYALFEPVRVSVPYTQPGREPIRELRPPKEEPRRSKDERARRAWTQTKVAFVVSGAVALGLFMVIQTEVGYHRALVRQNELNRRLEAAQQENVGLQSKIERKYSLEVIREAALHEFHMAPIESARVIYLNLPQGDQRIE